MKDAIVAILGGMNEDSLNIRLDTLQSALADHGRTVLYEDLAGVSGALYRLYWHSGGAEKHPERWSGRVLAICGGDPIARAARVYGFEIAKEPAGRFQLVATGERKSLGNRVDSFISALELCRSLWREGDGAVEPGFAGGSIGYAHLLDSVVSFEPIGLEEEPAKVLGMVLDCYGNCRKMLARHLSRVANFMEIAPAIAPFAQEGDSLRAAARILEGGECSARTLKKVEKLLWTAVDRYTTGCRTIEEFLAARSSG